MVRGLYTAAMGMTAQMSVMDAVTNNMANANTTAYKKDITVTRSFSEELMKRLDTPGEVKHESKLGNVTLGVFVDNIHVDFSNGSLRNTEGPLDLAISGDGFFVVEVVDNQGNRSEMYTRDGSFTLAADGSILTKDGAILLGQNGSVNAPTDQVVTISEAGEIYSGGEYIDTIRTADFSNKQTLRKFQDNLYNTTDDSEAAPFTGKIVQGFLENSNVNSVKELVDLINVHRTYEANNRMVTVIDGTLNRTVNDLGRK